MKKAPKVTAKTKAAGPSTERGPVKKALSGGHQPDNAPPVVQTIRDLQRTAGNAAVGQLLVTAQRQVAAPAAAVPTFGSGFFKATTYDGLLALGRLGREQLKADAAELPAGEPARAAAEELVKQMQAWEPILQSKGSEQLDQAAVNQAQVWQEAFLKARRDIESYKAYRAREHLKQVAADAEEARKKVEAVAESFADYQRGAFLKKDHKTLEKITGVTGKALEVSAVLLGIHEDCMKMVGWLSHETTHVDEFIEKFGPIAEGAHKVLAAYEALEGALNILEGGEGATEIDKEISKATSGLKAAEGVASLTAIGATGAAYVVYFGVILSVGAKCLEIVGVIIREHNHELNKLEILLGNYDSVDWSVEPGGRETFEFMTKVMRVRSPLDLPDAIPHKVDELMVESRKEFQEGTGEEVPIKGVWWWKHADEEKAKYWLFKNRKNVWRLLYGSISPPP
jgi:hypothetical protein